jgi:CDK-activating kinase assembly factor MAT1
MSSWYQAFNLLNDIDIPKTEARIAQFQKQNAGIIASNKQNAIIEALGQQERDELEKRAREERMEMVANAERMDREQEERARGLIGEALVCPNPVALL